MVHLNSIRCKNKVLSNCKVNKVIVEILKSLGEVIKTSQRIKFN